jgi:hypothetical protein
MSLRPLRIKIIYLLVEGTLSILQKIRKLLRSHRKKILGMRVLEFSINYWKWLRKKVTEFVV